MRFLAFLAAFLVVATFGCRKDPDPVVIPPPPPQNPVSPTDTTDTIQDNDSIPTNDTVPSGVSEIIIRFVPVAGNSTVSNSTDYFQNGKGDEFTVTLFNYYISNIKLHQSNGGTITLPPAYYLIKHREDSDSIVITGVPAGYYSAVEFLIGVDSIRNVSGAQSGALDPGHGMFWDWNTGYIFYKLEGEYRALSSAAGSFAFHIGGYTAADNCLRTATVPIGSARIDKRTTFIATVNADAAQIFKEPHDLGFDTYNVQGPSPKIFRMQADNYADMFTFVSAKVVQKP